MTFLILMLAKISAFLVVYYQAPKEPVCTILTRKIIHNLKSIKINNRHFDIIYERTH